MRDIRELKPISLTLDFSRENSAGLALCGMVEMLKPFNNQQLRNMVHFRGPVICKLVRF